MRRICVLVFTVIFLNGCAAVAPTLFATGAGVAAGTGVQHTLNGIAYKTFAVSQKELRFATLKALKHLDMKVEKDQPHEKERIHMIVARAFERTIEIEVEALTSRTARLRVVANQGQIFFKDAATATEIIMQAAHQVDRQIAKKEKGG